MRVCRLSITLIFMFLFSDSFALDSLQINAKLQYYKSKIAKHDIAFNLKSVFYDSIINTYLSRDDHREVIRYMMSKSKMLTENGEYAKAYNMYKLSISNIDSCFIDNSRYYREQRKECMLQLSNIAINMAMYDEAMSYLYELIKYNDDENMNYSVKANSLLGIVFGNINNRISAREYHTKAISMVKAIDTLWDGTVFATYNNYAVMFYLDKKLDSTLYYLLKSEQYCQKDEYKRLLISHYTNMALTYQDLGDYGIAENYYNDAIKVNSGGDTYFTKAMTFHNLGRLYILQNKYDKAYNSLMKGIEIATKIGAKTLMASMFSLMAELKYMQKDYKSAYEYIKRGKTIDDSVFNSNNVDRMMILKNNFESDRVKMEKERLEQALIIKELSNQSKNILLIILLAVIIAITAALSIAFRKIFKQHKLNTILNETIHNFHLEEQSRIGATNERLTNNMLSLTQIGEMLNDMRGNFKKLIDSNDDDERVIIAKHINSLINNPNTNSGWQKFRLYFERVNSSFFENLEGAHPDLSIAELKLCALIVMNMNAKKIAMLTDRTPRTVETLIYRLRKKMDIESEIKIISYLQTFLD